MRAGELRHRVTIQYLPPEDQRARDPFGSVIEEWIDYATVWAAVEPLSGREYFSAQQMNAEVTTNIRIRYLSGVTPSMRVKWGERLYNIQSVINVRERNRELHLMCKEVAS